MKRGFCVAVKRDRARLTEKVRICESLEWPKTVVLFSHNGVNNWHQRQDRDKVKSVYHSPRIMKNVFRFLQNM